MKSCVVVVEKEGPTWAKCNNAKKGGRGQCLGEFKGN